MASEKKGLETLPDVVIICILKQLALEDIINISKTNRRIAQLCSEKPVARNCILEGIYLLRDEDVKRHIGNVKKNIEKLSFNHCHWYLSRTIQWAIQGCKNLRELHVIECRLKTESLVGLIANISNLNALSFSIATFADVKKDMFTRAKDSLKNLKKLHLYYTSTELVLMRYHGECPTIMDFCHNLEQLVIDSAGMSVPELYLPKLSDPNVYSKLTKLCLTRNVHAGAQMFFYGTLQQLPNSQLPWKTLLMPNVNFSEFARKRELMNCLAKIDDLENLDLSCSRVDLPNPIIDFRRATKLKYLNLGSKYQQYSVDELRVVLDNCRQLTSLNLAGCTWNFEGRSDDFGGLDLVFKQCPNLKHLNISGEHQHFHKQSEKLLAKTKGLSSLALPACILCPEDPTAFKTGKRVMSCAPSWRQAPKRARVSQAGAYSAGHSTAEASTSSGADSSSLPSPPIALSRLVQASPNLTELEIMAVGFDSAIRRNKFINPRVPQFNPCSETRLVRDADLEPIGQLKFLRRLTLAGLSGLTSSNSLVTITSGCSRLEFLSVAYTGGSNFTGALIRALAHCHNLRDLRLEQPHMPLSKVFFESFSTCIRLERICLLNKHSLFQSADVLNMIEKLPRLVVLQILAGGTITACRNLTTLVNKRYGKQRPGMCVIMIPLMNEGLAEGITAIPAKHTEELTRFDSYVASTPQD